jgi:hypothetical protein
MLLQNLWFTHVTMVIVPHMFFNMNKVGQCISTVATSTIIMVVLDVMKEPSAVE